MTMTPLILNYHFSQRPRSNPCFRNKKSILGYYRESLPSFYEVYQEVDCLAKDGSSRRVDIIAIDRGNDTAIIIDPTVHFETAVEEPIVVHEEKKTIYDPTIEYFRNDATVGDDDDDGYMRTPERNLDKFTLQESDHFFCLRVYQERYPQRQCPDLRTFVRLHYRLCEYGKFNSPGLGRGRPRSTTPEVQEEILEAVNMTPSISTRRVALQVNVPNTTGLFREC
ncbi:hypothetical protein ANN_06869 [Periplaneta americana]|uniref:Uncharacterized protein n=1 Tax=Periplaneta americana TaxID=6978 RepID=A0ABQ8TGT2_PERAM|nr:hypothetical protein ANN_06869 [Periplaneta americana]